MSSTRLQPTTSQLRWFSLIVAIGFLLICRLTLHAWLSPWALGAVGAFAGLGLLLPSIMRLPYQGWMFVGLSLGAFNVRLLLCLTYYLLITPLAFFFRLIGRDKLRLRFKKNSQPSYWSDYDRHDKTLERYRRLF